MRTKISILAELNQQSVWKEIEQFFDEQDNRIFDLKLEINSLKIEIEKLKARVK